MKRNKKVIKYSRFSDVKITLIILLFILIYALFRSFQLITQEHISIYEVTEKQMAEDNTFKGIILRKEEVFRTENAGYLNYYIGDGEKVGKETTVYSLDEKGSVYDLLSEMDASGELSSEDSKKIRSTISSYKKSYDPSDYSSIYNFQYDINNMVLELSNTNMMSNMRKVLKESGESGSFSLVKAAKSGVISFSIDGMEEITQEQLKPEMFENMKENRTQLRSTEEVKADSPAYKLVTNENWSVVIPLSKTQYENLKEKSSIRVHFKNDTISATAGVNLFDIDKEHYARLDFNTYMIRYLNQRYVEIELEFNAAKGLKIPVSSVLEQEFYKIPKDYVFQGDASDQKGVSKKSYDENGGVIYQFIATDIYYEDEESYYVSKSLFEPGNIIVKQSDAESSFEISQTGKLKGVYNVNKGYCIFRYINILYENNEYCIVEKDLDNSLSIYDHIVINPEYINENDIIY